MSERCDTNSLQTDDCSLSEMIVTTDDIVCECDATCNISHYQNPPKALDVNSVLCKKSSQNGNGREMQLKNITNALKYDLFPRPQRALFAIG
uniref:Uncharacterized protein n=1 Tax=Setaria digitata TaxID=48799 RepID=A0A915PS58_9BILA